MIKKAEEIIERIADKALSFGCKFEDGSMLTSLKSPFAMRTFVYCIDKNGNPFDYETDGVEPNHSKNFGHPILPGDILKKAKYPNIQLTHWIARRDIILDLWEKVGIDKSLQQILVDEVEKRDKTYQKITFKNIRQLSPKATKLFTFIDKIFPKK